MDENSNVIVLCQPPLSFTLHFDDVEYLRRAMVTLWQAANIGIPVLENALAKHGEATALYALRNLWRGVADRLDPDAEPVQLDPETDRELIEVARQYMSAYEGRPEPAA